MEDDLKERIVSLSGPQLNRFLGIFINALTSAARNNYDADKGKAILRFKAINEMLHITGGKLIDINSGRPEEFPTEDFLVSLSFRAGESGRQDMEWALTSALRSLEKTH
jgi:hypothetical protein